MTAGSREASLTPHKASGWAALCLGVLAGCSGKDSKWVEKQEAVQEAAKAARKVEQEKAAPPKEPEAPKDPFWDDASLIRVSDEGRCPDGIWALFPDHAPGESKAEQSANEAKRAEAAKTLREARFQTRMHPPTLVKLSDYDAPKGQFRLEVGGLLDCQDSAGHVSIALNPGRAVTPPNSAAKQFAEVTLRIWEADPFHYALPMKSVSEAKDFKAQHQLDFEARVIFKLGAVHVDHKMLKTQKVKSNGIEIGGGASDWGAGREVQATIQAVRVTTDKGRRVVVETK